MGNSDDHGISREVDSLQKRIAEYAAQLSFDEIPAEVIHAAKVRTIDTIGAVIAGFFGDPCRVARGLAAQMPDPNGATIIGTRTKTTPDMAAFVNATTARYVEINDTYHWPGIVGGHPSDVLTPVLAAAEHGGVGGRDFITGVVLAYEVCLRINDVFHNTAFDPTNFVCLGTAVAAGKLFGLSTQQLSHCISMAVVPNVILKQVRTGQLTMFKATAAGQAGRAGVFAAMLARAGMEGPHLPFEGKAGWCDHVARERLSLAVMGGENATFKLLNSMIKPRPACGTTISSILATEKISPFRDIKNIKRVRVEVYGFAKRQVGTEKHHWNPQSRETADHSAAYVVAATLMDGTVTPQSFNERHLWNSELRGLLEKIEFVENEDFTKAYEQVPVRHYTRVTVETNSGERFVGETGGDKDDAGFQDSDEQVVAKFRGLTQDFLGEKRVSVLLDRLWHLDELKNIAEIPPALAMV